MCVINVFVQENSHDSTLGEGEVLHQDVKTSVLIIEELPDPPVTHEERERGEQGTDTKNTPLSVSSGFYPFMGKVRARKRHREMWRVM